MNKIIKNIKNFFTNEDTQEIFNNAMCAQSEIITQWTEQKKAEYNAAFDAVVARLKNV